VESWIGSVPIEKALVSVTPLVLGVTHFVVDGDEVLGRYPKN
jgi:hypothetical protein